MQRYFLRLAYSGTNYHGWQIQQNAHTVQAEMEQKIGVLLNRQVSITGCGRTDAGVHASEFFAHFDIEELPFMKKDFLFKLNRFLPKDIVIYDLFKVNNDMHARFSAVLRTYKYYISQIKDPFNQQFSYFFNGLLHVEKMNKAASMLMQFDDFTSFSKLHTQTATNLCKVSQAQWDINEDGKLVFTISADRFLRNMVRAVVGTLLEIGKEKMPPESIIDIIKAKDRTQAGFSVPARGLFLEKVRYPV